MTKEHRTEKQDFRLVVQSRHHYPHGIYSGTTNCYALQTRVGDGPWHTFPVVDFDDLSAEERKAFIQEDDKGGAR